MDGSAGGRSTTLDPTVTVWPDDVRSIAACRTGLPAAVAVSSDVKEHEHERMHCAVHCGNLEPAPSADMPAHSNSIDVVASTVACDPQQRGCQ
jgi:hypothetical protein